MGYAVRIGVETWHYVIRRIAGGQLNQMDQFGCVCVTAAGG